MYRTIPGGRPFEQGPDPRRNRGGRPRSLRRLVREALGDDVETLVRFLAAVFKDEAAPTSGRIAAAGWLATLAFGSEARTGRSRGVSDDRRGSGSASHQPVVEAPLEQVQRP